MLEDGAMKIEVSVFELVNGISSGNFPLLHTFGFGNCGKMTARGAQKTLGFLIHMYQELALF